MLGIMDIIMDQMVQEYNDTNKKIKNNNFENLFIKIIIVLIMIITFLIWNELRNTTKENFVYSNDLVDPRVVMEEIKEGPLYDFIINYFDDRTNMRFENIFKAFNKQMTNSFDSQKEKVIINNIINEKTYIMSYNDIKVYRIDGIKENENVVIITYDIKFSFSQSKAPSILLAYVINENDRYYFLDDFDIGISKYINSVLKLNDVQELYNTIKNKLDRVLVGNEELKLIYNSYRQYNPNDEKNLKFDFTVDKIEMLDPIMNNNEIIKFIGIEQDKNENKNEVATKSVVDSIFGVK